MSLRRPAIAIGVLAVIAAGFGCLPASVDGAAVVALAVVALGALVVAIAPRRRYAIGWLAASAIAASVAIAVTRGGPAPASAWPRYATWAGAGAIAFGMFAVLIWLVMSDGTVGEAESRQAGRLVEQPAGARSSDSR